MTTGMIAEQLGTDPPTRDKSMEEKTFVRHIRRPEFGFGEIIERYGNGTCKAVFGNSIYTGISESALEVITAVERRRIEQETRTRAEEQARLNAERRKKEKEEKRLNMIRQRPGYDLWSGAWSASVRPDYSSIFDQELETLLGLPDPASGIAPGTPRGSAFGSDQPDASRKDKPVGADWWYQSLKQEPDADKAGSRSMETRVVGVTYENRQSAIATMEENEQVLLVREAENPFDGNAISVKRVNGRQIGYLPRELAAELAAAFDAHGRPVSAVVTAILGRDHIDANLGVRIRFAVPTAGESTRPEPGEESRPFAHDGSSETDAAETLPF